MNILIIGATSGIGRELCLLYAALGNTVMATGRRKSMLEELAQFDSNIAVNYMDITNLSETKRALDKICEKIAPIDIVIISAGVGDINLDLDFSLESSTIMTNIFGWTHLIDIMYSYFERQGYGHLVVVSSIGGL